MQRILIASPKGGCGKTTVATNLAVYFARAGKRLVLIDCDHQASSAEWAKVRGPAPPTITAIVKSDVGQGSGGGWSLSVPPGTDVLLIDTPAGLRRFQIGEFLRRCDTVLVPVVPSAIDLRATLPFLHELKAAPAVRSGAVRVALVANRVKSRTTAARDLAMLAQELPFPLLATLRDTQAYVLVATLGKGLFDYATAATQDCRDDWQPLLRWLEAPHAASAQAELRLVPNTGQPVA